jgi:3-hydroxyacyl-CoA dehydrogenase
MLIRHQPGPRDPKGPMPGVIAAFEKISQAKVSRSAADAREMKFLRAHDRITMNRDRLLDDARRLALELVENGYKPPAPIELRLPGPTGRAALDLAIDGFALQGIALRHDVVVASALAGVLSGGATDFTLSTPEDRICDLEKDAFMSLLRSEATLARMETMLETGKPLRN